MASISVQESLKTTANTDCLESSVEKKHFAYGLNFYKIIWLFVFGSLGGFIIETFWCLFRSGRLECRASMVFGPFNAVYGVGAVMLFLCLNRIERNKMGDIFLISFIAGSVVEYSCSWLQEMVVGTISWDYSNMLFNVNGRVCLLFSVYWGILGLAWVYLIYPYCEKIMLTIPDSTGRFFAWFLLVFLVADIAISVAAISRWIMRAESVPAAGMLDSFLDRLLPDSQMQWIYPNMK